MSFTCSLAGSDGPTGQGFGMTTTAQALLAREDGLKRALSRGQIVMIGIGGAIGTGLFMGSGIAIGYAGPGVLVSYAIAAIIAATMVFSLSEMAVAHPAAGSFGVYAELYIGAWAGFVVRYTYWMAQVIAIGSEAVAVGTYMGFWFPAAPTWIWSVGFAGALVYVNMRSVANFGRFEYWFALIKVLAIVAFILFGLTYIFGLGVPAIGTRNLTSLPGGFFPHGGFGVWMGVLLAIFSFYGIEVIAVTSGEAENPAQAIPAALRSMALRLFLFYVLALGVMVAFVPWTETGATVVTQSPFVRVFTHAHIARAADMMNFVIITAALSSMNTNLYLCSRMLFSLARGGHAPHQLGKLSSRGAPRRATLISGIGILLAASVARFTPVAYNYLFGIALSGGILVWIIILISHVRFRKRYQGKPPAFQAPFFPYAQYLGLALLSAILITMAFDHKFWNIAWIVGVPWVLLLLLIYWYRRERRDLVVSEGV